MSNIPLMRQVFDPQDSDGGASPTIAIGCFASLCRDRLADPLMAFGAVCPEVGVGVHEMGLAELLPAVAAGRLALAVRPGGPVTGFASAELWVDRAVVAAAQGHRLAQGGDVTAATLDGEVLLISRDRGREQLHRFLVERLFPEGAPATRIVSDERRSRLLARVAEGEGIALLCESQVDAGMAHLAVMPVADVAARFGVRAYWRDAAMDATLTRLLGLVEDSREG